MTFGNKMVKLFPMLLRLIYSKKRHNLYKLNTIFTWLRKNSDKCIGELDIEISIQIYHQNSLTWRSYLENDTVQSKASANDYDFLH